MSISLLGAAEIRKIAAELELHPRKSLGQNFVIDANTCRKIVRIAGVKAEDHVVEIGPGLGSLTLAILEVAQKVTAIEIDSRLAMRLARTVKDHGGSEITIVNRDALEISEIVGHPEKLVANLPYNISVPVLLHFLECFPTITEGVVMVQYEVADRLAARPGSKSYGVPSAKAAWWCDASLDEQVSRNVFWPVPNVDSALVAFRRHKPLGDEELRKLTFSLIDEAFGKRRKMLRSALSGIFGSSAEAESILLQAGIDPTARGESLDVTQFAELARAWRASR